MGWAFGEEWFLKAYATGLGVFQRGGIDSQPSDHFALAVKVLWSQIVCFQGNEFNIVDINEEAYRQVAGQYFNVDNKYDRAWHLNLRDATYNLAHWHLLEIGVAWGRMQSCLL